MELQWNQSNCQYLHRDLWETNNLEQNQELRLPDEMPDISRVICAWGQPVLRSKEWRNDTIAVTCGVTVWVLYAPEDDSGPRCMETWLPFQAKWSLQDSHREGIIRLNCCLRFVDARTLSARKMMVRASLGLQVEVLEPTEQTIFSPGQPPKDLQLLRKDYPAILPREAGEKVFTLEEEIALPVLPRQLVRCGIYPSVTEQTVVGSRMVFKGNCIITLLYLTDDGKIQQWNGSYPFGQYADLDREYDKDAALSMVMAVSALDTDVSESGVRIKCGLVGQYVIFDRQILRVAEDAYIPGQRLDTAMETVTLPMVLDRTEEELCIPQFLPPEAGEVVDVTWLPDQPTQFREGNDMVNQINCLCQTLYYDLEGNLGCSTENRNEEWRFPLRDNSRSMVRLSAMEPDEQQGQMRLKLETVSDAEQGIAMITDLLPGEKEGSDPLRPSVVLRCAGKRTLWDLAKGAGSTVELIQQVNQLEGEPDGETMLLIPVL